MHGPDKFRIYFTHRRVCIYSARNDELILAGKEELFNWFEMIFKGKMPQVPIKYLILANFNLYFRDFFLHDSVIYIQIKNSNIKQGFKTASPNKTTTAQVNQHHDK